MEKLKTTTEIDYAREYMNLLQNNLDKFMRGSLFRRVPLEEKLDFLKEIAAARTSLWNTVYKVYPQTVGKSGLTVTPQFVTYVEDRVESEEPASKDNDD